MKKIVALLHKSQQLRDIKAKSLILPPKGRSNVIEFLIHHITKLPKCVIYATLSIIGISIGGSVSALTYSGDVNVDFTFNTSLSISLSSPGITINNLTPGTSSDSNIVDINVNTNNITGYYLTSTVGSSSNATTNLTHDNNINTFTSLATMDSISDTSNFDDNQWGYSYSIDNGITWINANQANGTNHTGYSGLPLYNDATHIATLSNKYLPGNDTINFKIAAKASTTQASGTYTNTINFITTAYPSPMNLADSYAYFNKSPIDGYYTMQDMEPGICAMAEENSELTVIDVRDNNTYTIAKLADGRCWMTTNLDLPGGTALYSETSNVPDGYPESGGTPYYTLPKSSIESTVYNADNRTDNCTGSQPCYSYYSWGPATAGSGINMSAVDTDAPYSICPKNWRLPTNHTGSDNISDFKKLMESMGGFISIGTYGPSTNPTGAEIYSKIAPGTVPNFVLSGYYYDTSKYHGGGIWGDYWSSTVHGADISMNFYFQKEAIYALATTTQSNTSKLAIRCIANNE